MKKYPHNKNLDILFRTKNITEQLKSHFTNKMEPSSCLIYCEFMCSLRHWLNGQSLINCDFVCPLFFFGSFLCNNEC